MSRSRSLPIVAALALASAATLGAETILPVREDQPVNSLVTGGQGGPSIAMDADGDFVVVWDSYATSGTDTSGRSIQARMFSSAGTPLANDFQVNTITTGEQAEPAVASRSDGRFVVAWEKDGPLPGYIYARRFDSAGNPAAAEAILNSYTSGIPDEPQLEVLDSGRFLVTWTQDVPSDPSGSAVTGRLFANNGSPLTSQFMVNTYTTNNQLFPAVAIAGGDEFVVSWSGSGSLWFRRYDSTGGQLTPETEVNTFSNLGLGRNDLATAPDGSFALAFESFGEVGGDPDGAIGLQRFAANDAPLGVEQQVNELTTGSQASAAIAADASGGFVIAWRDSDGSGYGVRARAFDSNGTSLENELAVNTYTTASQSWPAVARHAASGGFVVAWNGNGVGDNVGVFMRRFRPDGLFTDAFESGDVSAWSTAVTDGGDLAASAAAAIHQGFGMAVSLDDTAQQYVVDETPAGHATYRARFWVDPNGYTAGADGERIKMLQLFSSTPEQRRLVTVVLRQLGGQYLFLAKVHQDDDSWLNTGFHVISDAPHAVEFAWTRATADGANDGELELRIDGALVATVTAVDNDLQAADFVRWGAIAVKENTVGSLYYDSFFSCSGPTPIGP